MTSQQVLVVENEQIVALDLEICLQSMGYSVAVATSGQEAADAADRLRPDVVLMDIHLDGPIDGIQAAECIRKEMDTPLIFLTAYADHQTIERAAQVDPSGYILKPFNERELAAAIHLALHRRRVPIGGPPRHEARIPAASAICVGNLKVDPVLHRVFVGDKELQLTKKEFGILRCLSEQPGMPVSPEAILSRVWGPQFVHYIQTFRVHLGNLRKKIECTPHSGVLIERVHGVGYRLVAAPVTGRPS